jgi:O-antigen ligase
MVALVAFAVATWVLPLAAGLDPNGSGILGRVHEDVAACFSRKILWANVLHLISLKPWWGWGWGELNYAHFINLYPGARFCDILDNAHNLPLHLAVELGIPVAAVMCGLCIWLIARAKPWREVHPQRQMAWAVIALIGLHSMLEYPLWYGPFQMALGLSVWVLMRNSVATVPAGRTLRSNWATGLAVRLFAISILTACCGYAAWEYWRVSQLYLTPDARAAEYRQDTLAKVQSTLLFKNQVKFAELTTTEVTSVNAPAMLQLSKDLLHFSPEPRVVEKAIESATLLGRSEESQFYLIRYQAAFPQDYERIYGGSHGSDKTP